MKNLQLAFLSLSLAITKFLYHNQASSFTEPNFYNDQAYIGQSTDL